MVPGEIKPIWHNQKVTGGLYFLHDVLVLFFQKDLMAWLLACAATH